MDLVEVIARSVASKGRGKGKGKEEDEEAAVAAWVRGSSVVEVSPLNLSLMRMRG